MLSHNIFVILLSYPVSHLKTAIFLLPGVMMAASRVLLIRSSICPAWLNTLPMAVKMANRNRSGCTSAYSAGKATFLSNCNRLWVMTCSLSHAAFAPCLALGNTPAARSLTSMWCICSIVPALPRCHSRSA